MTYASDKGVFVSVFCYELIKILELPALMFVR